MTFTQLSGALLALVSIAAVVILALDHIIDGAATIAVIMGVLGISGGTVVASSHSVPSTKDSP